MILHAMSLAAATVPAVLPPVPPLAVAARPSARPGRRLTPVGQWSAAGGDRMCELRRSYADKRGTIALSISPWPIGERTMIALAGPIRAVGGSRDPDASWPAALVIEPGDERIDGSLSFRLAQGPAAAAAPIQVMTLSLSAKLPDLWGATALRIEGEPAGTVVLPLDDVDAGLAQLRACQAAQRSAWGIAPDEAARIATPAQPGDRELGYWFGPDDYPDAARRAKREGAVIVRWTIGQDGATGDCAVVASSGTAELDARTCAVIAAHRYRQPALDAAGRPMVSHGLRRVVWRLPR